MTSPQNHMPNRRIWAVLSVSILLGWVAPVWAQGKSNPPNPNPNANERVGTNQKGQPVYRLKGAVRLDHPSWAKADEAWANRKTTTVGADWVPLKPGDEGYKPPPWDDPNTKDAPNVFRADQAAGRGNVTDGG